MMYETNQFLVGSICFPFQNSEHIQQFKDNLRHKFDLKFNK